MSKFVSLHNHSENSNIRMLDCIIKPDELVKRALELGYGGVALTDHESLSGAIDFIKVRDEVSKENPDFKFIFGNEIYLIDKKDLQQHPRYYHFILLAKDLEGWQQLKQLSSRAWERSYVEKGLRRCPTTYDDIEEIVGGNPGHLLCSTACVGGQLPLSILAHDVKGANDFIRWCINNFGQENVALELQPSDSEEQKTVNPILCKLAKGYNIPFIVTTDSHYVNKEDFNIHSIFLNSKSSSDRETEKFYRYTYMMTTQEIHDILLLSGLSEEDVNAAIENTEKFSSTIETFDFRHGTIVPEIKIPKFELKHILKDWYEHCPSIKYYAYSEEEQDRYLLYQIEEGIVNKGITIDQVRAERIDTELDVILFISKRLNQNMSSYLNLAVDMINAAWQVSLVGCGRGSCCGFYICYLIGIVQVDGVEYDLPYWRFANKERIDLFDIDSDYQPEKTDEIIRIFREKYGEDNVLNCATFKKESLKSAILTVMRGLGYNNDEAQALAAMVPSHRGQTYTLKECLEGDEEKGFEPVPGFEQKIKSYPNVFEAVKKIEGISTNASIHASALYIFNNGYLPQNSLMRAPNGTKMTAFNMHDSDDMGALKMDVLRTDAQSKMAKCLDLLLKDKQIEWQGSLRKTYDKYIHPDVLDYQNPLMWEKMSRGEIANLFQFETMVGSTCIKKAKPTNVRQLAEINSIMRLQVEGNEQPIDRYVRFRKDINEWYKEMEEAGLTQHEQEILKKYLDPSYGVSGSQEILMRILMDPEITHFTLGEANMARKAIAKKQTKKLIQLKKDFYEKGALTLADEQ